MSTHLIICREFFFSKKKHALDYCQAQYIDEHHGHKQTRHRSSVPSVGAAA